MGKITKNQHYIPQFILRGFESSPQSKRINLFDKSNGSFLLNQPIKSVFAQNYFYDKGNDVERILSGKVEQPASTIINQIKSHKFDDLHNSEHSLIRFLCCQLSRTYCSFNETMDIANYKINSVSRICAELNDIEYRDDSLKFSLDRNSQRNHTSYLALTGVYFSRAMEDLEFHVLINSTDEDFIISDAGLSQYNWFYRNLNDYRVSSLFAKGIQIFMPLSREIYLCAYDKKTYKYGSKYVNHTFVDKIEDIQWLNRLQFISAEKKIAFHLLSLKVSC